VFGEGETPQDPPAPDDAEGLYKIGASLQRNGRCEEAMEFLTVSSELAPRAAKPHRELGTCLAKLGETRAAADHWARYLLLAPDAADASEIQARLDKARGTRTLDLPTPPEEDF
jgi:Flp pilus assembly protein TadD